MNSSRFQSKFNDNQNNQSLSNLQGSFLNPSRPSAHSLGHLNPTASTSSSTLVNELQEGHPPQNKLPPSFDPFDWESTRHITVCERPVGAQTTHHASNSHLVHSTEQLSILLNQNSSTQYSDLQQINPPFHNYTSLHHLIDSSSESVSSTHQPSSPQGPPSSSATLTPNPNRTTSNPQLTSHNILSESSLPNLTHRKPRSSIRDQQLLQKLKNSPNKLNLNRTTSKNLAQHLLHSPVKSSETVPSQIQSQTVKLVNSDPKSPIMAQEDVINSQQTSEYDNQEDDSSWSEITPQTEQKKMQNKLDDIFVRVSTADLSQLSVNNNSNLKKTQSTQSFRQRLPPRTVDPKTKSRAPLEHLRDKMDFPPSTGQYTRQLTSDAVKETPKSTLNTLTDTNQVGEAPADSISNLPKPSLAQDNTKFGNHNSIHNPTLANDTHPHHTIRKTGWPSLPIITAKKSKSDPESPEDFPISKSNLRVTFQQPHNPLSPNTSRPENSPSLSNTTSQNCPPLEDTQDSTMLDSYSKLDPGQTTLATPRVTGYYPNTPSAPEASTSRWISSEQASRRLAKIKNRPASNRKRNLRGGLENLSDQGLDFENSNVTGQRSRSNFSKPYNNPNTRHAYPLPKPKRNDIKSSLKGKEKEVTYSDMNSRVIDQSKSVPNDGSSFPPHPLPNVQTGIYDQTIINPELTRVSNLQTPHPPGWLGFDSPSRINESPGFVPSKDRPAPLNGVLKNQKGQISSSSKMADGASERVIYASNPPRPSAQFSTYRPDFFSNNRAGESLPIDPTFHTNSDSNKDGTNDTTPRPTQRTSHQTFDGHNQYEGRQKQTIANRVMNTPHFTNQTNAFSSPSFEGFHVDDEAPLTSTPAPGLSSKDITTKSSLHTQGHNDPQTASGPMKTVKDLTSAVIEFVVEKNHIESLVDMFSPASQNPIGKKKLWNARHEEVSNKNQLIELLKSSEKVEKDRLLIQSKFDQIQHANTLTSRFFKYLSNVFSRKKNLKKNQSQDYVRRDWRFILFGLIFQLIFLWLAFNLAAIRTYNSFIQVNALQSSPSWFIIQTNCYHRWSKKPNFSINIKTPQQDGGRGHSSSSSSTHRNSTTSNYPANKREHHDFLEGLIDLLEFSIDWFFGFKKYYEYQSKILSGFGHFENDHPDTSKKRFTNQDIFFSWPYFKSFLFSRSPHESNQNSDHQEDDAKVVVFKIFSQAFVDSPFAFSVPT